MSPLVKTLLAVALIVPLVAYVAGSLSASGSGTPDRQGPVIINDIDPAGDNAPGTKTEQTQPEQKSPPQQEQQEQPQQEDDVRVVTPTPKPIGNDDDDEKDDERDDASDDTRDDTDGGDDTDD